MSDSIHSSISLIVEKLKTLHPYKVILFGSHAYGTATADSDIDLLVVLDIEKMPESFQENMENKIRVRDALGELSKKISIDLIVHTKPMYQKFNVLDSMFAREIRQKGQVLYEADNA